MAPLAHDGLLLPNGSIDVDPPNTSRGGTYRDPLQVERRAEAVRRVLIHELLCGLVEEEDSARQPVKAPDIAIAAGRDLDQHRRGVGLDPFLGGYVILPNRFRPGDSP